MTRAELLVLAERVEKAEGPSRELDAEIVWRTSPGIVGIERGPMDERGDDFLFRWEPERPWSESWAPVPHYTARLDAAALLVPVHCSWARYHNGVIEVGTPDSIIKVTKAQSAALALCAAALRARAEEARDE